MTRAIVGILAAAVTVLDDGLLVRRSSAPPAETPRFDGAGRLVRPDGYREWIWLSSGLGMSYGPGAESAGEHPPFDNVFVAPPSYRSFLATGRWPDGTMLVLELRESLTSSTPRQGGRYQGGLQRIEVEVKRNGAWTFYGFDPAEPAAPALPRSASCYGCHATSGAVDNTFVQFYPTLVEVARAKGTLAPAGARPRPAH